LASNCRELNQPPVQNPAQKLKKARQTDIKSALCGSEKNRKVSVFEVSTDRESEEMRLFRAYFGFLENFFHFSTKKL